VGLSAVHLRFSGIHKDALVGADSRLTGVVALTNDIKGVFGALTASGALKKHVSGSYKAADPQKTPIELTLVREPENTGDANAIRLEYKGTAVGYLPKTLALQVAPLLDKKTRFTAHLTEIKPYTDWRSKGKETRYSVEIRIELLTQAGRSPNLKTRNQLLAGFEAAQRAEHSKVLTVIPERLDTFSVDGKTLTQRYDQERGEKSYYAGGFLVARGKADPQGNNQPDFARANVAEPVKAEITRRLNELI